MSVTYTYIKMKHHADIKTLDFKKRDDYECKTCTLACDLHL